MPRPCCTRAKSIRRGEGIEDQISSPRFVLFQSAPYLISYARKSCTHSTTLSKDLIKKEVTANKSSSNSPARRFPSQEDGPIGRLDEKETKNPGFSAFLHFSRDLPAYPRAYVYFAHSIRKWCSRTKLNIALRSDTKWQRRHEKGNDVTYRCKSDTTRRRLNSAEERFASRILSDDNCSRNSARITPQGN